MNEIEKISEEKDELYYSDLIYYIKRCGNLEVTYDEEIEERVYSRIVTYDYSNGHIIFSDFLREFTAFTHLVGKRVNEVFASPFEMSKYSEIVEEELNKYITDKEKTKKKI